MPATTLFCYLFSNTKKNEKEVKNLQIFTLSAKIPANGKIQTKLNRAERNNWQISCVNKYSSPRIPHARPKADHAKNKNSQKTTTTKSKEIVTTSTMFFTPLTMRLYLCANTFSLLFFFPKFFLKLFSFENFYFFFCFFFAAELHQFLMPK